MLILTDFGPLKPVLGGITALSSIAVVLIGGFKKRGAWEPSSEDLPRMTQQIASIIISVFVAILFVEHSQFTSRSTLEITAAGLALASFALGLSYVFAVGMVSYSLVEPNGTRRVLGGLWRRKEIDETWMADPQKLTKLLTDGSPDFATIWSRTSRQLSKILVMVLYVMLLSAAGLALATAAVILIQPPPDRPALGIISIRLLSPLQADNPVSIGVRVANTGKTPARDTKNAYVVTHLTGDPASVEEPPEESFTSSETIPPNTVFAILAKSEFNLSAQGNQAINSGSSKLYVYGVIRYKDYQGNDYTTHYCAGYDAKANVFALCGANNQAN